MWTARREEIPNSRGQRVVLALNSQPATYADVVRGWQGDANLRSLFNSLLADTPYFVFRWETPVVTSTTMLQQFEFVLLDSPGLAREPDPEAFAQHFPAADAGVATFPNLSGDAVLVVPCALSEPSAYGHLAAFVRFAPEAQRHSFWQAVGEALTRRVGVKPVWLSTAGAGVSWLHVRLDDRPKYYGYAQYKRNPAAT